MKLALILLIVSAIFEIVTVFGLQRLIRKVFAAITLMLISFASGAILLARPSVASAVILILSTYRVINMLRLVETRMPEEHLRRVTRTTSIWLICLQVLTVAVWALDVRYTWRNVVWLWILLVVQLLVAMMLFASTRRNLRTTRISATSMHLADRDLPTVSVAVPARNEDEQLNACLASILASNYPKLEVLVLDDCSQDRTPEIIRSFAHDGVRFIPGESPKSSWLAKNQAYDRLAKESSGELILFCGVDVRFDTKTIRQLVLTLVQKQKMMLSVVPLNAQSSLSLLQSMRYMWELALPRRLFNRPPVLSSCWLIEAAELKRLGGFGAIRHAITPEAYFAREAIKQDGYSFARSDSKLGLTSIKSVAEQRSTAIRTRYPQLHRRPELAVLLSLAVLGLLAAPFVLAISNIWHSTGWGTQAVEVLTVIVLLVAYGNLCHAMFPRNHRIAALVFPLAVLSDIVLLNYSMWKYEFSEVDWKGRNVCIPVMRTIPHLPKV